MQLSWSVSRGKPSPGHARRISGRSRWLSALAAVALPLAVLAAPSAFAGSTPPFTIGPNGSAAVPGADGANNLPDLFGAVKELGPLNSSTTKRPTVSEGISQFDDTASESRMGIEAPIHGPM